ncbi:MAG: TIGR03619 family F420-dependent LLM class oxidoreductase [Gammaproteobacteria bacterium]|jgi:probable F420-dependent oxidoreductase|nr:TIGR03619 family F420-dependent LLM class oxidoreductase [Gammaproteobacteria bacterium]MBT4491739.1 TIGR03619 family F420-dependent LLM class oxidoreductase [Gammaproteobacteria bacterium]MBT7371517.1 TIGR03619 family F420-dependent LLM class oxidoreductase [Gammaproteobacteria bacterium]
MKFGLFGINTGPCAAPDVMTNVAVAAEGAGFESVWTGEHVVLPDPQEPPSPAPPLAPFVHPFTALAYVAASTSTLLLGTGITLVAQRNAVVLAKETASVDQMSKGRLLFGIGAGYLNQEFQALGIEFSERGARTDEYIDAIRELWTSERPEFEGQFVKYKNIQSRPQPHQAGGPPIIVGGVSNAAYRRALEKGQGWYGFALDIETSQTCIDALKQLRGSIDRNNSLGELEISITPRMPLTNDIVKAYEDMGVDRLILLQTGQNEEELLAYVDQIATDYIR